MKKRIIALVLTMSMVLGMMVGCGSDGSSDNGGYTVKVATMTTGFTVILHYAIESGIYDELGLNIEESYFENGPAINEAIAAGDIDVGGVGEMPSITGALANGSKVIGWMEDDAASVQIYARNDSSIVAAGKGAISEYPEIYGTADDWKGKEVICAKGTSSHFALLATLNLLGLSEDDITIINMEGASGAAAFASGTGDIFVGFDPQWAEMYSNSDEYTMISSIDAAGQELCSFLVGSADFVENHPEEATLIIKGLLMSEQELAADENKYYEEMFKWQSTFGSATEDLATYSASIKPLRSVADQIEFMTEDENGNSPIMDSILRVAEFMVNNNVIEASDIDRLKEIQPVDASLFMEASKDMQ